MNLRLFDKNGLKCLLPESFDKLETNRNVLWAYRKSTADSILIEVDPDRCLQEAVERMIMSNVDISDDMRKIECIRQGQYSGAYSGIELASRMQMFHDGSISSYWKLLLDINGCLVHIDIAAEDEFERVESDFKNVIDSIEVSDFQPFGNIFTRTRETVTELLARILLYPIHLLCKGKIYGHRD